MNNFLQITKLFPLPGKWDKVTVVCHLTHRVQRQADMGSNIALAVVIH